MFFEFKNLKIAGIAAGVPKNVVKSQDLKLSAEQIGKYKRSHWRIENSLHHVLDVSLGEDRSPAKKSKNNLALIRKFAYNILRLATLQQNIKLPITDLMFYFSDTLDLLGKYIFDGIEALN